MNSNTQINTDSNIMKEISERITSIDWNIVIKELDTKGYSLISQFLPAKYCIKIIGEYDNQNLYRKTINMQRHNFGLGEYRYFKYPLPDPIGLIRKEIYPKIVPIANRWMSFVNRNERFPDNFYELKSICNENGQKQPTVLILKYTRGGYNTLHQDLYGVIFFPFQLVFLLSRPNHDFTGGEFVLTQQNPRAQSKAIVLNPMLGDMIIITTNFRPIRGNKGYYKVQMRHGISEVQSGKRYSLGIIFHDAAS